MNSALTAISALLALAVSATASAGFFGLSEGDAVPEGSLCCINSVCLFAQSEADCATAGGQTVADCAKCTGETAQPAAAGEAAPSQE